MKNPKTQKQLKKLISEEWIAGQIYLYYIMAMSLDTVDISGTLKEVSVDELDDHMTNLFNVAKRFGYDVPKTTKEFEKYSDPELVKIYNSVKAEADLKYYVDNSIKAELLAIKSYEEALKQIGEDEVEIRMVALDAYYEEFEHLQKFQFLSYIDDLDIID